MMGISNLVQWYIASLFHYYNVPYGLTQKHFGTETTGHICSLPGCPR